MFGLQVLNLLQPKADKAEGENKEDKGEVKPELSKEESKAQATAAIQKYQDFLAVQAKVRLTVNVFRSVLFIALIADE